MEDKADPVEFKTIAPTATPLPASPSASLPAAPDTAPSIVTPPPAPLAVPAAISAPAIRWCFSLIEFAARLP